MGCSHKNLEMVLQRLKLLSSKEFTETYQIPGNWGYQGYQKGVISINPFIYYQRLIQDYLYPVINSEIKNYLLPLSLNQRDSNWLIEGSIYCLDVRTATSWDHDGDGQILQRKEKVNEIGTFLKTILLLPHIKRLKIDILYLLPVLKIGEMYSKGELGSFYAIKNFYQLNQELHDPLLDLPGEEFPLEVEFKALIEACHILGIRVVLDYPLRTASRDNELIQEHPDWFYWIKKDQLAKYKVPEYSSLEVHVAATPERLQQIYHLPETLEYVNMFSHSPNAVDQKCWNDLLIEVKENGGNILDLIERNIGLTTAPAYADWINDPQPSWDDITFLRLYLDEPEIRKGYYDESFPPFLFYDSIKTNWYQGKIPNTELWEYLSNIIPYYQVNFGIDGARIDMAHALPEDLEKMIISKSQKFDPDFKFISEDLQNSNHTIAAKKGYHSIIGETWWREGRLNARNLQHLLKELPRLLIPCLACAETPDTPRAVIRKGGRLFSRLVAIMNFFLPNTIPFISNGFELFERQPMNLGLDNTDEGRYVLAKEDIYYGRLAFFDRFQLHWLTEEVEEMLTLINHSQELRQKYWHLLNDKDAFYLTGKIQRNVFEYGYRNNEIDLVCLVNLNFKECREVELVGEILISSAGRGESGLLKPGEFRVMLRNS